MLFTHHVVVKLLGGDNIDIHAFSHMCCRDGKSDEECVLQLIQNLTADMESADRLELSLGSVLHYADIIVLTYLFSI